MLEAYDSFLTKSYNNNLISEIIIEVKDLNKINEIADLASKIILKRHENTDDFKVIIPLEQLRIDQETKRIFNLILAAIAGISLIVGGIGIMNIMLASITQRTREIGVRRCLGATRRDILLQFLIESIVITFIGGAIGIIAGVAGANIIAYYGKWRAIVSLNAVALSFGVSLTIGLIFGLWPAKRAAEINPIEALRYE